MSQNAIPRGVRIDSRRRRRKIANARQTHDSRVSVGKPHSTRVETSTTTTFFRRGGEGDKKEGKYRVVVKLNGTRRCNFYTRYADGAIKNFIPRWDIWMSNGSRFIGRFYRNKTFVSIKSVFLPRPREKMDFDRILMRYCNTHTLQCTYIYVDTRRYIMVKLKSRIFVGHDEIEIVTSFLPLFSPANFLRGAIWPFPKGAHYDWYIIASHQAAGRLSPLPSFCLITGHVYCFRMRASSRASGGPARPAARTAPASWGHQRLGRYVAFSYIPPLVLRSFSSIPKPRASNSTIQIDNEMNRRLN